MDTSPSADSLARRFAAEGYAVFEGLLKGELLELLRDDCAGFMAREDERMDAAGVDSLGLNHRGARYFANERQRERPQSDPRAAPCLSRPVYARGDAPAGHAATAPQRGRLP